MKILRLAALCAAMAACADVLELTDRTDAIEQLCGCSDEVPQFEGACVETLSVEQLGGWASVSERAVLRRYRSANRRLATALQQIWSEGELTVGMRTLLPFVAMFHCNRFGLDGDRQAMLARAMVDAWDPKRALVADGKASGR